MGSFNKINKLSWVVITKIQALERKSAHLSILGAQPSKILAKIKLLKMKNSRFKKMSLPLSIAEIFRPLNTIEMTRPIRIWYLPVMLFTKSSQLLDSIKQPRKVLGKIMKGLKASNNLETRDGTIVVCCWKTPFMRQIVRKLPRARDQSSQLVRKMMIYLKGGWV